MILGLIWLVWLVFGTGNTWASSEVTLEDLSRLEWDLRKGEFADLADLEIKLLPIQSKSDYFQSKPSSGNAYVLHYNPKLFSLKMPPSEEALRAILAHELVHIRGYTRKSIFELIWLGLKYLMHPPFVRKYERHTDLEVLELGMGQGLHDYREWLYRNIDPHAIAEKRKNYFTPEEILRWMHAH